MTRRKKKQQPSQRVLKAIKETGCKIGFFCSCGKAHGFPLYVIAHWTAVMSFTCEACETEWTVVEGVASNSESESSARGWDERCA